MRSSTTWGVEPREESAVAAPPSRSWVLGLAVDRLPMDAVVERIATWIDAAQNASGSSALGGQHMLSDGHDPTSADDAGTLYAYQVITLNPEIAMACREDAVLRRVVSAADLVVPDGVGITWAARLRGAPCPERVTGVDLVERLAERAARRGDRLFLLGAAPGVAVAAGERLVRRYPGLELAGTYSGSPDARDDAETLRRVREACPDVLVVAYGAPAQERWIARLRTQLGVPVAIGVGGALDVLAGRIPRAPQWMRRLGLEWLYRLARQPWRWRRMLALPRFVCAVLWGRANGERATASSDNTNRLPGDSGGGFS